jgi:DNA uptake protein ComE-like DNA-binding protein
MLKTQGTQRRTARAAIICGGLLLGLAAGCLRPQETEDERLRRQTAEDTRQLRHDAQNAGVEARKAADKAQRAAKDIVAGVRQGWQEGAPAGSAHHADTRVNVNTATVAQLAALPGISTATARRIVHKRPYASTDELVSRQAITSAEYDRVSDRVAVHGEPDGTSN